MRLRATRESAALGVKARAQRAKTKPECRITKATQAQVQASFTIRISKFAILAFPHALKRFQDSQYLPIKSAKAAR